MGCTASKDAVEMNSKYSRSAQAGRGLSMRVQAQGSMDNGYHMVALTSSTYGILKVDTPQVGVNSVSLSNSSHDAFYEKLKNFDVPDEMVAKSWSEVSRNLPKIPPPTRTDSPRRTDSLRRTDSPRLQSREMDSPGPMDSFRGSMDSPRQRGSLRRTDSPRRLPSQVTKNDQDTINTWELMDGLDEDGTPRLARPKMKPVERNPGSPVVKPFERSITFSTIHTLSELDSEDPSKAIAPGPAGNFLNSSNSVDSAGKENTNPVRGMTRSVSSPIVPKRDEITVRLTPSSPSPAARVTSPNSDSPHRRQSIVASTTLTPEANAAIQEVSNAVSNAVSKSLLPPASPSLRSVGIKKSSESPRLRQPATAPMTVAPEVNDTLQEGSNVRSKSVLPPPSPSLRSGGIKKTSDSPRPRQPATSPMTMAPEVNGTLQEGNNAGSKSNLPPPSPLLRSVGTRQSSDSSRSRQPANAPMTVALEVNGILQEGSDAGSKSNLPPPSPSLRSVGTKNASLMQGRKRPTGSQHSKSPTMKSVDSPVSLTTKLETEIGRVISEERGMSGGQSFSKQPAMMPSPEPDSGRVRAVAASLRQEVAVTRSQSSPRRVEVNEASNQPNQEVPRFASPIHVLSLAASFDLENRKNSISNLVLKGPPGQGGRKLFSKQQSMPSPSLRAMIPSGQGISLQPQASAPNHGKHGSVDTLNVNSSQRDSSLLDSDLLASFEEALEMLSTDDRHNVRDSKSEATSISGVTGSNRPLPVDSNDMPFVRLESEGNSGANGRQSNGNKGANAHLETHEENTASKSFALRKIMKPDPWARFEMKCPPAGEDRVVLYTTSLRGIRKTFEDCNNARFIFQSFNIAIDERDVSIHAEFRQELKELLDKPVPVPQAFIKGRFIGGMDIITQLHEDGTLAALVDGLPPQLSREECDGCGGVRFVPCSDCSGSTKVVNEAKEVVRCSECNENGLMRCPICY